MIGQTISHYKITEKIGEGGMGVVYKVRDTKLDRDVALKFLPESLTPTKEDKQRFIREAKSAAALNHPNICTVYSVDEYEDRQFISMEYINGETLRTKIEGGDLDLETALNYTIRIADALGKAHQYDIIHRDIKPENIMLDEDGRIKVMDFGLAKLKQGRDITKTGDTVGTLAYSSPEQIRGQQVDHRSDLFSLGIVLYEMLTGRKPFQGEHQAAMTYSIVNEEPVPLNTYLPDAPEELIQIIDRLLAKDPEDRIGSAGEVAELLGDVKESYDMFPGYTRPEQTGDEIKEPTSGGDSSTISITLPGLGFGKKKIGWKGLLASVTVVLALVLFGGWWFVGSSGSVGQTESNNSSTISSGTLSQADERSVAVLPFSNLGGSGKAEPLANGIHDGILTRLSNISDLQVISRTSVDRYRNAGLSLSAIADSLDVRWIVEGGVLEMGDKVKVNAKLVDPRNDINIWAKDYRRNLTAEGFFAIQEEITRSIAEGLKAQLSPGEQERITGAPTKDLDAYRLYVQGRAQLNTRSVKGMRKAVDYFQQAIRQDSSFALAWSGLADGVMLFDSKGYATPEGPLPDAEKTARRALQLNPNLAEAHASMGLYYMSNSNAPAALKHLQEAVSLSPSYGQAHHWLGLLYLNIGKPEPALKHLRLATELAPQHYAAHRVLVQSLIANKKYREALTEHDNMKKLYIEPMELAQDIYDSRIHLHRKNYDTVIQLAKEVRSNTNDPLGWSLVFPAVAHLAKGDSSQYKKLHQKMDEESIDGYRRYALLGDIEAAYKKIEKLSTEEINQTYLFIRYYYPDLLKPFREDPRYDKLIRDLNTFWGLNPDGSIPEEKETI